MKRYTPRPGTLAARAVDHIKAHGRCTTHELADALGIARNAVHASLQHPVAMGALVKSVEDNKTYWDIGKGKPLAKHAADLGDEAEPGEDTQREPFVVGLFSDGELCFMHAGKTGDVELILTKEQTNIVFNYMLSFNRDQQTTNREPWSLKHD